MTNRWTRGYRHHADSVGILVSYRHYRLQGPPGQVTVTDLTTAHTSLRLGLSRCERREVIVEDKLLRTLYQHLVQLFHIHLGSEGHS